MEQHTSNPTGDSHPDSVLPENRTGLPLDEPTIDLVDLLLILWRRKIGMTVVLVLVLLGAFIRTMYLVPEVYSARATILGLTDTGNRTADILRQVGVGAGMLASFGVGAPSSDLDRFATILRSRTLRAQVVQDLDLLRWLTRKDWARARSDDGPTFDPADADRVALELVHANPQIVLGLDEGDPDRAILSMSADTLRKTVAALDGIRGVPDDSALEAIRTAWYTLVNRTLRDFSEGVTVEVDNTTTMVAVTVKVEDDAEMAARIANHYLKRLDQYLRENTLTKARRGREFIEARFEEAERDLRAAERRLEEFKTANRLLSLSEQTSKLVSVAADLEAQIELKKIQREVLRRSSVSQANPQLKALSFEISGLERRMTELETGGESPLTGVGLLNLPKMERELAQLMRDKTVQETLYTLLAQQYELAKIDEAREQSAFEALDYAEPATKRDSPHRSVDMVIGGVVGGLLALAYAALAQFITNAVADIRQRSRQSPSETART